MNNNGYSKLFKALSDAKRLEAIEMLIKEELCVVQILKSFQISQPTLSHDMKILREAGLVNARRQGIYIFYSINSDAIARLKEFFDSMELAIKEREEQL